MLSALVQPLPLLFTGDFLYLGILFLVVALIAGVLGARDIAGFSMEIARLLIILFVILAIISFIL